MKQDLKIALVEQNRYHARLIVGELSQKYPSNSISVFSCGQTALNELRRNPFDIAIIGLDLPDVDGLGFIELIRKENRHLPIIAIGDIKSKQVAVEVLEVGADEYLAKDSSFPSALPNIINKLSSRRAADEKELGSAEKLKKKEQANLIRLTADTLYHEVNNPLMTILGMTELILDNGYECDREVAKKLRIIRRSAQRIQFALTRLSTISQPTIKETPLGKLIDPKKSRVAAKSGV